jgi:hypothetical protein
MEIHAERQLLEIEVKDWMEGVEEREAAFANKPEQAMRPLNSFHCLSIRFGWSSSMRLFCRVDQAEISEQREKTLLDELSQACVQIVREGSMSPRLFPIMCSTAHVSHHVFLGVDNQPHAEHLVPT